MQDNEAITPRDLYDACSVLFGTDIKVSSDFLKYVHLSGLKAAYRKRAFETHPDRATLLAAPAISLEEQFKELNLAYERLNTFIKYPWKYSQRIHTIYKTTEPSSTGRKRRTPETQDQRRQRSGGHQGSSHNLNDRFWRGNLPGKKLLVGRFLYYSGIITMRSLIEAIVWQKRQRPMVGSIAAHWNWMAHDDVRFILSRRYPGEMFCECALRCGFINPNQLKLLLWRQKVLQPKIGKFFISQNIVTSHEMERIVAQLRAHNSKYWRT
jgi:hypothetical protein